MRKKILPLLFGIFIFLLSSCGAAEIDYTRIRSEFQKEISLGVENQLKLNQSESSECLHNYEDYGIRIPYIQQYNDEKHMICCPLCKEILEYELHSEKMSSVIKDVAALADGTPCCIKYSICECGAFYKALLYRGNENER